MISGCCFAVRVSDKEAGFAAEDQSDRISCRVPFEECIDLLWSGGLARWSGPFRKGLLAKAGYCWGSKALDEVLCDVGGGWGGHLTGFLCPS
jgi:hypothetical protein